MKRSLKYNTLSQIEPHLVKEWHPSANHNLNPRNLEIVYPKKVWWLCSEGHEWQATIKNRMNNHDCPICDKGGIKKETDDSLSIPMLEKHRRKYKRFKTNAIAVLKIPKSGHLAYAEIKNYSRKGLCIETDSVIRPGSEVKVKFDRDQLTSRVINSRKSLNTDTSLTYSSTVRWYKILDDERSVLNVHIGLEFK